MSIISKTPTTLITGFLGAGKTTLINALLAHKPTHERWAILVNEFGKIGIDGGLIGQADDVAIKEVSGGCICCTSQLPLQIALVRLLGDHRPNRLLIEPTGLSHPEELINQLSHTHWQTSLALMSVLCVVSAKQWQDEKYRTHDGYQAHVKFANAIIISQAQNLPADEMQKLHEWIAAINPAASVVCLADDDLINSPNAITAVQALLDTPFCAPTALKIIPLNAPPLANPAFGKPNNAANLNANQTASAEPTLPYRYHDTMSGFAVGGWRLPAEWALDGYALQHWLLGLADFVRIKGIIHTDTGWQTLNITPHSVSISPTSAHQDSRLELILNTADNTADTNQSAQWTTWDAELMALIIKNDTPNA
ncbi:hypothetical protein B0181_02690 [Moraxella caviae]|uniref:Uncharacterized GTP-binding protein YjiA n=1 Tax=Moraxella caviae TaxID=34060 RepID=A0A1T0A8L8_9GAMM|nr:GTP-binding protein [Moraxella caviae]OOR91671.1 hypothetical protein B0181_02690 [Moraxella caviae]STZ10411.1 Uncharacterized GTP-binding protein YjiA [Moraxella caviae]